MVPVTGRDHHDLYAVVMYPDHDLRANRSRKIREQERDAITYYEVLMTLLRMPAEG